MKLRNQNNYNLLPIKNRIIRRCSKFFKGIELIRRKRNSTQNILKKINQNFKKYETLGQQFDIEMERANNYLQNVISRIPQVDIIIKTLGGTSINIKVTHTDTIEDVKIKVQEKCGIPVCYQQYFFKGKYLDTLLYAENDNKKLILEQGVINGSIIRLVGNVSCIYGGCTKCSKNY